MEWLRSIYLRSMAAIPPVLLAVCWLALWMVWPHGSRNAQEVRVRSGTRLSFTGNEQAFNRAVVASDVAVIPSSATRILDDKDDLAILLFKQAAVAPKYLEETEGFDRALARAKEDGAAVVSGAAGYRPRWDVPPAFAARSAGPMELVVEAGPALKARGFRLPEAPAETAKTVQGWQAVLQVECGPDGKVEHVFLEAGSGNPALDSVVVRWVGRGTLSTGTGSCGGRVAVNFGAR
jgi:hypothetical protein